MTGPRRLSWDEPAPADLYDRLDSTPTRQEAPVTSTTLADITARLRREGPTEPTAEAVLEAATTDTLLTAAYALTHRMEAAQRQPAGESVQRFLEVRVQIADLRAQRDLITAEVLRRTGGQ